MLDDLREENKILYRYLLNTVKKKSSHAYLFNTNKNENYEKIIFAFVKTLMCKNNYTNNSKCLNCSICEKIDNNIFSEITIIKPENMIIKKEQLLDLKKSFSKKAIESNKKIYIIYEAEKMNVQSANSLLKFLEDPDEDIIAVLITDNMNLLLKTIISRCQIINLNGNTKLNNHDSTLKKIRALLLDDKIEENDINETIQYLKKLNDEKIKMINYNKKMYTDLFKTKEQQTLFFDLAILFYKDIINKEKIFSDYQNDINYIQKKEKTPLKGIKEFIKAKEHIKCNINSTLLIDKVVMNLKGD